MPIFVQPGEIIFYESASVLHGRPTPFKGDAFANIFVHFAPTKEWDISSQDVSRAEAEERKMQRLARRAEEEAARTDEL